MKYRTKTRWIVPVFCWIFLFIARDTALAAAPSITTITPSSGPVGTTVTISGNNFASSVSGNTVSFNGTTTNPTSATTTQILVVVPEGATSGNISVTTSEGASNAVTFSISSPALNSITPNTAASGDTVILSGSGFSTTPAHNMVIFSDGRKASVINAATTQLSVEVPRGAVSGPVTVTVGGFMSNTCAFSVSGATEETSVPTLSEWGIVVLVVVITCVYSNKKQSPLKFIRCKSSPQSDFSPKFQDRS